MKVSATVKLRSHPDLLLREHIAQVRYVAEVIIGSHSSVLGDHWPEVSTWLDHAVSFHDVGKASAAFQNYIVAPDQYRAARERKAHTPLSTIAALITMRAQRHEWQQRLAVAAATASHHSGFKILDELEHTFATMLTADILREQLDSFPWSAASETTGLVLETIRPDDEPWHRALDDIEEFRDLLNTLSLEQAVLFRLRSKFILSILLEADKAFLAVAPEYRQTYASRESTELPTEMVDAFLSTKPLTPLNELREQARRDVLAHLQEVSNSRIFSVTLPTGTGKTMLAASWALRLREILREDGCFPKIIIVLPYLSIIDQTQREYVSLLQSEFNDLRETRIRFNKAVLSSSHSLAERVFDPEMDGDTNDFFIDTWQSEIVITTFDQLLFALIGQAARHDMRFHNLCDALIVMDEIQTLPCKLWHPLHALLTQLTEMGNSRVLAMSATQPGFLENALELVFDAATFFAHFGRYRLKFFHRSSVTLDSFLEQTVLRAEHWGDHRVLITLNTRNSARAVRDAIEEMGIEALHFLSADVTPRDRLRSLEIIKDGGPCVVVSTQCIEAGVDIDMDLVLRDFAPLDSILQVAGRCNRNGSKPRCSVEIHYLTNRNGRAYAEMIYDMPLLQATRKVLGDLLEVDEEKVHGLAADYFEELKRERDTGEAITEAWARWEETDLVRHLLRGKDAKQEAFVVLEQDPGLLDALIEVQEIQDRWERRRRHRQVAARLARITVSVYARPDMDPSDYADRDPLDMHWLLQRGYYQSGRGLDLRRTDREASWGIIL